MGVFLDGLHVTFVCPGSLAPKALGAVCILLKG